MVQFASALYGLFAAEESEGQGLVEYALIIAFIVLSTLVFVTIGRPVKTLILVGALNGLILPIALGIMLIAAHRKSIVGDYKHPVWLTVFGVLVVVVMSYLGGVTLFTELPKLFS